jgi:non-ribosomal peptide synthase protein (TIGR01720 family)
LPAAQIGFNYLGRIQGSLSSRFRLASEPTGPNQSPRGTRAHLLDVTGVMTEERLALTLLYSASQYREETATALMDRMVAMLMALSEAEATPRYTPSDFPMAGLNQAQLDRLVARRRADRGES